MGDPQSYTRNDLNIYDRSGQLIQREPPNALWDLYPF